MKQHYSRYNIDLASHLRHAGRCHAENLGRNRHVLATGKTMTILYALGWTQHSIGSQIIRSAAMVQLLLGNVGMPGGGVNALRGHSNIQGLTDLGLLSNSLPGYLTLPGDAEQDYNAYIAKRTQKPLRPGSCLLAELRQVPRQPDEGLVRRQRHGREQLGYDYLPKLDIPNYDVLQVFDLMGQGKVNGYMCQGFNPIAALPDKNRVMAALARLKWLVVMDPLATETSEFWRNVGPFNDVKSAEIQTEVIRLPTTCFAEEDGSLVNSSRWLQWHWKGADGPGEAQTDIRIMSELFLRLRNAIRRRRQVPRPDPQTVWPYKIADEPSPEELAKEINGSATADFTDATGAAVKAHPTGGVRPAQGRRQHRVRLLDLRRQLDRGGNQMARRDNSDPYGMHQHQAGPGPGRPTGGFSTTAPRPTCKANWDPKSAWCGGTARPGAAPTCRTSRPMCRRKPG
jgi:formate dehydrogenase major subunit